MDKSGVRFETLDRFLVSLGFERSEVPGKEIGFQHPASGAILLYPPYKPGQDVSPTYLAAARATLDLFGILERREFDEQLRQRVLAG